MIYRETAEMRSNIDIEIKLLLKGECMSQV